jgi:hypothetical protein
MSRPARRAASLAVASVLALGACADGGDDAGGSTASPGTSPATSPATESEPAADEAADGAPGFPDGTEAVTQEPAGARQLTVTDVRVARHDGFDRVVLDLGGQGTPGWDVGYVDEAFDDGSGEPVDVDGDAVLSVRASGTAMPTDSGVEEYDGTTVDPDDTESVEEVVYRFWFEGYSTAFIGVDGGRKAFRVFALSDPTRLVVDVRH